MSYIFPFLLLSPQFIAPSCLLYVFVVIKKKEEHFPLLFLRPLADEEEELGSCVVRKHERSAVFLRTITAKP